MSTNDEQKMKAKPKRKRRKAGITAKAKKKSAAARAVIRKGTGIVRINKRNLEVISPKYIYDFIREPIDIAGNVASEANISVIVKGGGAMGQAVAARAAIAKALVAFTKDEKLRKTFLKYDRMLIVDDVRRVETKKPLGPKARKKKQKSKR